MTVRGTNKYTKHGCHITGNLLVVSYGKSLEQDPEFGRSCRDYVHKAKILLKTKFPMMRYKIKNAIPDLVVEVL